MKVLVDTGATNSIIHQSSLSRIRYDRIHPVQQKFFLANKTCITITGYVTLEIMIHHIKTYVTAAITETLCCDLILGEDWIKYYRVTINRFRNRIEILGNKATVPLRTTWDNNCILMKLRSSIYIPPYTEQIVEVVVPVAEATNVLYSPNIWLQKNKNIVLSQALVQIKNYSTKLVIRNTSKFSVHLTRNTNMGMASILTQDDQIINSYEFSINQHVPSNGTASSSSTQQTSNIIDMEKILDQMVQHITDGQERSTTRQVIEKYSKTLDSSSTTIALTSMPHTIPTGDHPPINSVPYRGSLEQQRALKKIIDRLEQSKQIRQSSSPWSAPVLLIKKKDGEYRFVVDYRKLNAITRKDSFPIPTIESTLQQLQGNSYFSKLDLRSGYFQIPINEIDRPKTAFITTTGLWEFNVLPMGLSNAPPSFQRIIYNLVVNGREHYCLGYLDDLIIFSKSFQEHLHHLNEILNILNEHRFQLNTDKCSIMRKTIEYLGHIINEHGIAPLHENIKAIQQLSIPDYPTLKQANEFMGGLGFYRKFIKNFSRIASPLHRVTNLTRDNKHKFIWTDAQREAVNQLKQIITGPDLMLEFPDPDLPYVLSTDASKVGLGAILKQITQDGRIKIIYYLSRVLTNSESRYSTTELEALAMVWSITKLRPYLLGRDFTIETDHCPLCQFHKKKSRNGRLDRWAIEILTEYNIMEIKYKKGKCHCDADLLSRYPIHNDRTSSIGSITRKQSDGYLFPHADDMEDNESSLQPTAMINAITRSVARTIVNQQQDQPIASINSSSQSEKQVERDASLTSSTKIHSTRWRARTLQEEKVSSPSISTSTIDPSISTSTIDPSKISLSKIDFSLKVIKEEQLKDQEIQEKLSTLINHQQYEITDGIIYRVVSRGTWKIKLIWIPKSLVNHVLFLYHDHHTAAHFGINKTTSKLINKYYWINMHKYIADYIKSCIQCAKYNYERTKQPGKLNITPPPNEVMNLVGMDFWGPTNQPTRNGHRYIITLTDYLSKFVFAKAVRTNSAEEAADFFLNICYQYGAPAKLITDQGPHFIAELMRKIIESCNTTHVLTTPYHPMSNGQVERFNATFAPSISKLINEQVERWNEFLQPIIYAYNTSQHATTSYAPFQIMFGRENMLLMDPKQLKISLSKPNLYYEKMKQSRKIIIDYSRMNIQNRMKQAKSRYDQNRPDPTYNINDLVLLRVINRASKLQEKFEGPYRIIDKKGPSTFIVQIEDPNGEENPNYIKQVTVSDMKHVWIR
ncbi:unnamed protein product [Adineta steineri]|uniref:RNA-directed DNA polymerase n=1 Tax=Adineta steineri TaxID=433720 RepID=A0A819ULW7_9BILA|nr:unnamed protein product [Adineta steineri]